MNETPASQFRDIGLQVGGMAAVIAAISYIVLYMISPGELYGIWFRFFSLFLVISFQIIGLYQVAKTQNDNIFFDSAKATLIITILVMLSFSLIDYIFYTLLDPQLVDLIVERSEEISRIQLKGAGKTEKEIEATLIQMRKNGLSEPSLAKSALFFAFGTIFYFIIGVIISGISYAVLKSRKQ